MSKSKKNTTPAELQKSKIKKHNGAMEFAIILMFFAAIAITLSLTLLKTDQFVKIQPIVLYAGCGVAGLGLLIIIIAGANKGKTKKKLKQIEAEQKALDEQKQAVAQNQVVQASAQSEVASLNVYNANTVNYIPSVEAKNTVDMGRCQTTEQKFEEIARMDKTQFVIYVARLFSAKGYQVRLTPVMDNYGIDMLVEKNGIIIAVGCLLTKNVLGADDIKFTWAGKSRYPASNVMALTNSFFNQSAVDFAKVNRMSLVDRVILGEDFMC